LTIIEGGGLMLFLLEIVGLIQELAAFIQGEGFADSLEFITYLWEAFLALFG